MAGAIKLSVLFLMSWMLSSPAMALTPEDIEQRFERLERENTRLRRKLEQVESILKQQGIDPANPLIEQPVSGGERDAISVLRRMDRFEKTVDQDLARIKVDGFISAGFSTNDESGGLRHRPYSFNEGADFESDSVLGLQMTFRINEQAKVVTQAVANGWGAWDTEIGWAYLAYDINDQFSLRAGRMRLPFYLYSESLDVGYSYPWVRPPLSLYTTEISNYDGFDATYQLRLGEASHRLSAYLGTYSFDENTHDQDVTVEGDDVFGLNWTVYWNDWTYRFGYSHLRNKATFEVETGLVVPINQPPFIGREFISATELSDSFDFYSYSTAYDDGTWLAVLETAVTDAREGNFLGDEVQGVFTLGYHWGKWMPYGGYGREYYKRALASDNQVARSLDRDYKLNFIGLRYDITPGIAAKLEWNRYYDLKGTSGPFENADAFVNAERFDSVNIYTFLIDAVF